MKITILLILFLFPLTIQAEEGFLRKSYHLNVGGSFNKYIVPNLSEDFGSDDFVSSPVGFGGQVSFDWQGLGHWGVQVPVQYYYHNIDGDDLHEINFGVNALYHFTQKSNRVDPYFALGLSWLAGFSSDDNGMAGGGILMIPFLSTGLGLRYDITPRVGIYTEVAAKNLLFIVWEVQGSAGVSFNF